MSTPHVVLELKTGRDSQQSAESSEYLFSSLPKLKHSFLESLLGQDETISFEIINTNQSINFLCYCPVRIQSSVMSALTASYPQIVVTPLPHDPLEFIGQTLEHSDHTLKAASLGLKNNDFFPLKTYQEFGETDSLSSLLSVLSKLEKTDIAIVQFIISEGSENWRKRAIKYQTVITSEGSESSHPQKGQLEKKVQTQTHEVSIRLLVSSVTAEHSDHLIDQIAQTFKIFSNNESNSFVLKKPFIRKKKLIESVQKRSFSPSPKYHLSSAELASLYHFPNQKLSSIPNIAWGKTLLGEPPDNLPIVTKETDPEIKQHINVYAKTYYKNEQAIYGIKRQDRRRHMYVIGKTGTGKSTLLANMAINDLKQNEGICVIDPHGDLVENLLDYIPSHRINDVIYFNPSDPERTVQINLFEGKNVVHRELIASGIISIFQKLYGYSWGPRLEYILRNALHIQSMAY